MTHLTQLLGYADIPNHGSYLNYIKKLKYMALYIRLLIR